MTTLYLVHQGTTLRKEQGRFCIEVPPDAAAKRAKPAPAAIEIPIVEVQRVLVFGHIQLTTAALTACLDTQIPVVFLSQLGDYKGHLWSAELTDLAAEAMQFHRWQTDPTFQLSIAKRLVSGKLLNSKQLLLRLNRKRQRPSVTAAIQKLDQFVQSAATTETLDSLRGFEGISAAVYFPALGQLLTNPGFSFSLRHRRPPTDPVNALLSFGYTLLFNNVMSLILAEGLNPYLGNLHRSDRKDPHLAFDLMEEFRSPVVDSLVVMLINKQILKPTDFTAPNAKGGVYLHDSARRIFLQQFEDRINETITHPAVQAKVSYRRAIQLQIQHYKHCLIESVDYDPFLRAT